MIVPVWTFRQWIDCDDDDGGDAMCRCIAPTWTDLAAEWLSVALNTCWKHSTQHIVQRMGKIHYIIWKFLIRRKIELVHATVRRCHQTVRHNELDWKPSADANWEKSHDFSASRMQCYEIGREKKINQNARKPLVIDWRENGDCGHRNVYLMGMTRHKITLWENSVCAGTSRVDLKIIISSCFAIGFNRTFKWRIGFSNRNERALIEI